MPAHTDSAIDRTTLQERIIALETENDKLRHSEHLLKTTQRLARVGGWEWHMEKQTMFWTDEAYRIHDLDPAEIIAGSPEHIARSAACYRPEDRPVILAAFQRCAASGIPYDLEFPLTTDKGRQIWIRTTAEAVWIDKRISKVIGNIIDITERKQAELRLQENELALRAILNASPEAIFLMAVEGTIITANAALAERLQIPLNSLIGSNAFTVLPPKLAAARRQQVQTVVETGLPLTFTDQWDKRFVEHHLFPICGEDGRVARLAIFAMDVSERKLAEEALRQSEERYHTIIKTNPLGIFLIRDGRYQYANPAGLQILGFPQDFDISTIPIEQTIDAQHLDSIRARIKAGESGSSNAAMELTVLRADGSKISTESTSVPIQFDDGPAILIMGRDISRRKKDAELLQTRLRLSEAAVGLNLETLLRQVLDEAERLTGSCLGFFHFYDEDRQTISTQVWSTATSQTFCRIEKRALHYHLEKAGVWADCIRERRPVIHNDYPHLPNRRGMPAGHAPVNRELVVPVIRNERIVATLGIGNKVTDYEESDVQLLTTLANLAWDIVLRKQAEEDLVKSERKFRDLSAMLRLMCDNVSDMIWAKDLDKHYIFANKALCRDLLGAADTDEPLGKTDLFFAERERSRHADNPQWHTYGEICRDTDQITMDTGRQQQFDEYGNVQGKFLYLDVRKAPFLDRHGQMIGTVGSARDITAAKTAEEVLRESEERFRTLSLLAPVGIYLCDPTGQCQFANPRWCEMAGMTAEEALGSGWSRGLHPEDQQSVVSAWQQMVESEGQWGLEYRFQTPAGKITWVYGLATPQRDSKGKIIRYIGVNTDITERKQAEETLQATLAEKETLLREVHHRVKNNMAAIIGLFELQRQAMDDPQAQTVLAELSGRIRSMSLVHEKLYRSESLARINFQEYLQSLISHLRTSFNIHNIRCEVAAAGVDVPLDLAVPCGMIVNELVTNALKYAFPPNMTTAEIGDCRIHVALSRDQNTYTLSVSDNGVGLPADLDWAQARTIGLVLVRMLGQHQLGGTYEVDRRQGTRFTLSFTLRNRRNADD